MNKKIILYLILLLAFITIGFGFRISNTEKLPQEDQLTDEPRNEKTVPDKGKDESDEPQKPKLDNLPEVAIIIDDLGNNFEVERKIKEIDAGLTLAVLPFRSNTQKVVNHFTQKELILHLPLEPMESKYFEEEMIMTGMSDQQIKANFNNYLNNLNGKVTGVNNHKGSRFTSQEKVMRPLLEEIKSKDLYFVDSYTKASSVGSDLAKQMNVPTAKRDLFLDNSNKKEAIRQQFNKLITKAKEEEVAIAIGHARPNTISVLQQQIPKFKDEVDFVNASEVVK